jgi:hypothetical protein
MKIRLFPYFWRVIFALANGVVLAPTPLQAQGEVPENTPIPASLPPARLSVPALTNSRTQQAGEPIFIIPKPAHAAGPTSTDDSTSAFTVPKNRNSRSTIPEPETGSAKYLLPENKKKSPITPENANLNLPKDVEILDPDSGQTFFLAAGTYRQILQFPIDSPSTQEAEATRVHQGPPPTSGQKPSRYAEPILKPVWVRYESLEKIKIGLDERRGGIDLPANGPAGLKPRLWYAKSETADVASSVFYFVFGGAGYTLANLAGWSAGNTRDIPAEFPYRLIRK